MMTDNNWAYPTAFKLWGDEERRAIARVIASDRLTMGAEVEAFEAEFAKYHSRDYAIMVNSGSSANLIAVAAWFRQNGKIYHDPPYFMASVPAIAWSTTYAPIKQFGGDFSNIRDVDDTWNSPLSIPKDEDNLFVLCPVLGNPVLPFSNNHKIMMDCCESLGAKDENGELLGKYADIVTYSFYHSHQISAIEGGMILTDDAELFELCKILRAHGWTRDVKKPKSFEDEYNFTHFGFNVRPLEMHAAIAREQLKKLDVFVQDRLHNFNHFCALADKYHLSIKMQRMTGHPSPFGISFTVESPKLRTKLVHELRKHGIDCRLPTGGSFLCHEYGSNYKRECKTPVADSIHYTGLFLGCAPYDISDKLELAADVMKKVF